MFDSIHDHVPQLTIFLKLAKPYGPTPVPNGNPKHCPADADTVFLRDVTSAYNEFLDRYDADGTFMYEEINKTTDSGDIRLTR